MHANSHVISNIEVTNGVIFIEASNIMHPILEGVSKKVTLKLLFHSTSINFKGISQHDPP